MLHVIDRLLLVDEDSRVELLQRRVLVYMLLGSRVELSKLTVVI